MEYLDTPQLLKQHGLRATPQRLAVAELLLQEPVHVTAQSVHLSLKDNFPSISHNTVYLTLSHFEEAGLVRRFYVDGKAIFDSNTDQHDHAYCQQCKTLIDVPSNSQSHPPQALHHWRVTHQSRIYSGLCPSCHGKNHQKQ